ncbi:MAG: orange carotenoid protein N-terminal domain-containing protein [Microcoleaceae cyanobacterium]
MTFAQAQGNTDQTLAQFKQLSVDQQLALLWFMYTKMGKSITPAAPGAASSAIGDGIFNQIKELDQEEQLQVQRDMLQQKSTEITREYGSLDENTKLLVWYRLAQGMDEGTIIPMPDGYEMSDAEKNVLAAVEGLEFQQQITFLRNVVAPTGSDAKSGAAI